MVRWIGFDMDECIGSVMPLFTFVSEMPHLSSNKDILMKLANIIFHSEQAGRTWFIRPVMFKVIERISKAFEQGKINGAFVFSNNGSRELVQFVAFFLNYCIWEKSDSHKWVDVFQMAVYRDTLAREGYGMVKNFEVIQKCLIQQGLPPCSSEQDLLFYDDMNHELQHEIRNYVNVPPYFNQTNINNLIHTVWPLNVLFSFKDWQRMCKKTILENKADFDRPDNPYKRTPQSTDEFVRDIKIFQTALTRFLRSSKQGQTRKNR